MRLLDKGHLLPGWVFWCFGATGQGRKTRREAYGVERANRRLKCFCAAFFPAPSHPGFWRMTQGRTPEISVWGRRNQKHLKRSATRHDEQQGIQSIKSHHREVVWQLWSLPYALPAR